MKIVTIRTDKPEAEIGLYEDEFQLAYTTWSAHRQLGETIHQKIGDVLHQHKLQMADIGGIVCLKGPGSFTGLRIGISVANALAYALHVPIVGIEHEDRWIERGIEALLDGAQDHTVVPAYGAPVHITQPRK